MTLHEISLSVGFLLLEISLYVKQVFVSSARSDEKINDVCSNETASHNPFHIEPEYELLKIYALFLLWDSVEVNDQPALHLPQDEQWD